MALYYRIEFSKQIKAEELGIILSKINSFIGPIGIIISDFNDENFETDKVLKNEGYGDEMLWIKEGELFNYLEGYLKIFFKEKIGAKKDTYLKEFKRSFLILNKEELNLDIEKILIQEGQMLKKENWVEIPD